MESFEIGDNDDDDYDDDAEDKDNYKDDVNEDNDKVGIDWIKRIHKFYF